jgi:sporulation protein YlmC with PRC-barrel domain/osmotically-inducible protein OsmY
MRDGAATSASAGASLEPGSSTTDTDASGEPRGAAIGGTAGTTSANTVAAATGDEASKIDAGQEQATVRAFADADKENSLGKLKGQQVRANDGTDLGKVHDFVLDASTGKIAHIVVSSGGVLGVGDKLRLISHDKLERSATANFTAGMTAAEFRRHPEVDEKALKAGNISVDVDSAQAAGSASFILASQLEGKDLKMGETEVGEVEDVHIDFVAGRAMAVVEVEDDFAGNDGEFLVPFSKFEAGAKEWESLPATLTKADFGAQESAGAIASATSEETKPASDALASVTTAPSEASATEQPSAAQSQEASTAVVANSDASETTIDTNSVAAASEPSTPRIVVPIPDRTGDDVTSGSGSSASVAAATQTGQDESFSANEDSDRIASSAAPNASAVPSTTPDRTSSETTDTAAATDRAGVAAGSSVSGSAIAGTTSSTSDLRTPDASDATSPDSRQADRTADAQGTATGSIAATSGVASSSPQLSSEQDPADAPAAATGGATGSFANSDSATGSSPVVQPEAVTSTPLPGVVSAEENLTPTGQTSADQNPASAATASAIRQALDGEPSVARENVQVTTKVVLRGTVQSEEAKRKVEELAREAAGQSEIDNQITVETK